MGRGHSTVSPEDRPEAAAKRRDRPERLVAALRGEQALGILDASSDAVLAVGADGTVAYANAMAAEVFSAPTAVLVGQPADLLLPRTSRRRPGSARAACRRRPDHRARRRGRGACRHAHGRHPVPGHGLGNPREHPARDARRRDSARPHLAARDRGAAATVRGPGAGARGRPARGARRSHRGGAGAGRWPGPDHFRQPGGRAPARVPGGELSGLPTTRLSDPDDLAAAAAEIGSPPAPTPLSSWHAPACRRRRSGRG